MRAHKTSEPGNGRSVCANGNHCRGENCELMIAFSTIIKLQSGLQQLGNRIAALEARSYIKR